MASAQNQPRAGNGLRVTDFTRSFVRFRIDHCSKVLKVAANNRMIAVD
jgi:hypothetical protein